MNETTKNETRNYLSAAGFFLFGGYLLLQLFNTLSLPEVQAPASPLHIAIGSGLFIISTLLIILRKRDMMAILFMMFAFQQFYLVFTTTKTLGMMSAGFIFFITLITLTAKDKQKWLLFLIPLCYFIGQITLITGPMILTLIFTIIVTALSFYYAFACITEKCKLPGRKLLTDDEITDFKASGSVLGYMLFALIAAGYAIYYIFGETVLPLEFASSIRLVAALLMIIISVLLFTIGKMRFTPVMFTLIALTCLLSSYSSGIMFVGIGCLYIIIGLYAILRKDSRILPGMMLILYGFTDFFSVYAEGTLITSPLSSTLLNLVPCLIAIYLAIVVYSQRKLPVF